MTSAAHHDVNNLCYQALVQFRDLYRVRPAEALLRYNMSKEKGETVGNLTQAQLKAWASEGRLCFEVQLPSFRHQPKIVVVGSEEHVT